MRYRDIAAQHSISEQPNSNSYLLQLERDNRAGMLILHILDKNTGKRTEVRGKMGYETDGYDPNDKLHQLLDKVGKSASVSDLMNGDVVSINPRHPDGASAKAAADKAYDEDRHPNEKPIGPETKPTMPSGTIRVKVSDVYDWYKLGQHISDLEGLGKHDFGKGPPEAVISFGSEEQEHKYIELLKQLGLEILDVDPGKADAPGVDTDSTYNVESNVFTNARMNAIKAGKKEFKVGGKTYKITGDTKDEEEAVARISEESGKEMLKIFRGMHHDAGMNKDMDRYIQSHDWELRDFTPDMFPSEEEFFDYDDPFDRVIDIDYNRRVDLNAPIIVGPKFGDGKYSVIDGNHRAAAAQRMGKTIKGYFPVEKTKEIDNVAEGGAETSWSDDTDTITLQDILELTKNIKQINLPINDNLKNKLIHWDGNPEEMERVNQVIVSNQFPILIMVDEQGQIEWILDGNHRLHKAIQSQAKTIPAKLIKPSDLSDKAKKIFQVKEQSVAENFADGKNPGRKGLSKRMGVNTKASVSSLRKTAKNSSGEKQRMAHWLANMKAGRKKAAKK